MAYESFLKVFFPTRSPNYSTVGDRIKSFEIKDEDDLNYEALAVAGFHYKEGTIKCYSCRLNATDWKVTSDPIIKHWILSPNCEFLENDSHALTLAPEHREYTTYRSRYDTFQRWPLYIKYPTISALVNAGFFYINNGDKTKCFFCGIVIHSWEKADNPIIEHEKWSMNCQYIKELLATPNRTLAYHLSVDVGITVD